MAGEENGKKQVSGEERRKRRKIPQPVTRGAARVPMIMQLEALECGAACLAMIMAYYQKWVPLEQVRLDCGVSRDGSNARNVMAAAKMYGFETHGYRMETDALKTSVKFPCIIHWNFNHFVVLNGFQGKHAVLNDPARGTVKVTMEELDQAFTGICLVITPGEDYVPGGKRKSTIRFARQRLRGAAAAVFFVMLTTVISYLFGVIDPVLSKVFYDRLLTGRNLEWLNPFIMIMGLLCVLQIVVEWVRVIYNLRINGKMAVMGSSTYMWKVLRLPMEFFSQRMTGDIMQRMQTNTGIAGTLVETAAPLALNTIMMVFYLVLMIQYSPLMTLFGLFSILVNVFMARIISQKRINLTRVLVRDESKLSSTTMAGISMTETIKASGAENGFFRRWSGFQASVNTQTTRAERLNAQWGILPTFINNLASYMVVFLGVRLAMDGNFTIGAITTFQMYLTSFTTPAMTLVESSQTLQEMRTDMERVEDVMQYPTDANVRDEEMRDDIDYSKLRGGLELKHVSFGYSKLSKPLIKDFSMTLKPGSRVAIVGPSGCGKSTLSKLISGLYNPWSGEILYDGRPIQDIPRSVFTSSVAVVDQDIVLFEDTISANVRMWDDSIQDFEVIMAARDAQIHDDIIQRPGGYRGHLNENGRDLSGGQRQRLEIARVLAQDPCIIILDEATSALDAKTEYDVVNAIRRRGITCIVIAHRLSTIRDCDEIIVLDHGEVVERGTHDELYANGGAYTELVTSE